MKVEDLDLRNLVAFNPKGGLIQFMGHRVLLVDAVAMGLLRRELINSLGVSGARNILTRLGYAHGWLAADYLGSEHPDLLNDFRFGPALHLLQGLVTASRDFKTNVSGRPHHVTCIWEGSFEAEQHILQFGVGDEPVCWTLTGWVSGYSSRVAGRETYCIEHKCVGKGDAFCSIENRPKEDWGGAIDDQLSFFQEENIGGVLKDITTKLRKAERRLWQLQKLFDSEIYPPGIIASSPIMRHLLNLARRAARVDSSVVVTGESGVGKELIAQYIHDESARAGRPFIAVNCGAVAETLLESEFFGHIKGAFTGADRDRVGLFEAANGGTIFLDEIGEMPLNMQVKLLRALQEKKIRRVGESKSRFVDFRVIASTNRNLNEEVEAGRFRRDLYYRLCVIGLEVPPLRERAEDILPFARFFLNRITERTGSSIKGFSPGAVEHLLLYNWPGNARELKNVIERAVALCSESTINVEDLPPALRKGVPKPKGHDDIHPLEEIERKYILAALDLTKGDKRLAAEKLNIGLRSLYRKLKEYEGSAP
jgi:two-component system response regulator HydG